MSEQDLDSYEDASKLARLAFEHMSKRGIAPRPQNFTLWYEYAAARNPALSAAVDSLKRRGTTIGEDDQSWLYDRFFGEQTTRLAELKQTTKLHDEAMRLQSALNTAGKGASHYGQALENFDSELGRTEDAGTLRTLVAGAIKTTAAMRALNGKLERQVAASAREITALKTNLEHAQRMAVTDGLTGITNRAGFDRALAEAIDNAIATASALSLLMIDLDRFKRYNDDYGHQVGDMVLRGVSQVLVKSIKGRDLAARYGGEEFAIILPDTNINGAASVGEAIRRAVASRKVVKRESGEELGAVTVSIGVASFRMGETADVLIQRADEALYAAKERGRNRVVVESSVPAMA